MNNQLNGILLVGGKSSRMGTDKAQIVYRQNTPEWKRITTMLQKFCNEVFVVYQDDQASAFEDFPSIIDCGNGPLAAIAQADKEHPGNSWCVVACDLPLLDESTLEHLFDARDTNSMTTYYLSAVDGMPEPLCAIYENTIFPMIHEAVVKEQFCPRRLLRDNAGKGVELEVSHTLKNANTPAEKLEVEAILSGEVVTKVVTIRYFAQLKELAKVESEQIETTSVTPAGVYEELQIQHQFPHKPKQLMVAINEDFSDWNTPLKDGDELVFIPPVAGG